VLAVDLSLSSLCYAKRKTVALGLTSITYAQADILALGRLDRKFDVIECAGVLHHLADPFAGWSVLLDLLRPGGVLYLGLYSRLARQSVARGRAFVVEHQYSGTAESIRTCRQHLIAEFQIEDAISYLKNRDFFSTSACRDLLFHVQEHCLTLEEIGAFITRQGLHFLGFNIGQHVVEDYLRRFPDDPAATDLRNWHAFETDNPLTFKQMYQFYVQKPPVDPAG
jgi:SAM-dependent methyltransferase